MASQSLYRKWRSQTFDEVVGQEAIIRTLKNALQDDKLGHAYLFTGPRGTGKTTTARLLAKTVNCTNPRHGEPCNTCQQCREITAGTSFNVIEIDAASNRGIDSIRELREKVMMPPVSGKYKIYILDEAHMLTTEAFNALLKTLEEPPDYAIFVMATTDVQKMLPTVLSRCQRFDFKRLATRQIIEHVLRVAQAENIEIERSAAELIARTAAGGMRDALSLLDQAIAYSGQTISLAQVQAMLGVADARAIWKLLAHIAGLESPALLYLIHELAEAGTDLRQVNTQAIEGWRALMLAKAGADVGTIMDLTEDEVGEVQQLLPAFTLEELTEYARVFAQNDLMQKNLGTPQLGLELAALECLEIHRRVQSGLSLKSSGDSAPAPHSEPSPRSSTPSPAPHPARAARAEAPVTRPASTMSHSEEAPPTTPTAALAQGILSLQQVQASWDNVKARTRQKSPLLATYIGMSDVLGVEMENEQTVIIVRTAKVSHFNSIREENRRKEVEWALGLEFGRPCKLRVLAPDQSYTGSSQQNAALYTRGATISSPPAHRARPEQAEHVTADPSPQPPAQKSLARPPEVRENKKVALSREELKRKVREDPVVQEIIKTFQATIEDIQPK